jgi:hypothetical protein
MISAVWPGVFRAVRGESCKSPIRKAISMPASTAVVMRNDA